MRLLLLALLLLALPPAAQAHKPSDSYLVLEATPDGLKGHWDIALRDLDVAPGLDGNRDGAITWGEVKASWDRVAAYALSRLHVTRGETPCALHPGPPLIDDHTDGPYAVLSLQADCPAKGALDLRYTLFAEVDPLHRGLLRLEDGRQSHVLVLGPDHPEAVIEPGGAPDLLLTARRFFVEGVWHIWLGYDHLLFLVTLLLPAVLRREDGAWRAAPPSAAVLDVLKTVTAFTSSHSLTLALAALGAISLPSRLVESLIAASIVVAALNNVHPVVTGRLWPLAFAFGLVHGLGFAGVLADLGLPSNGLATALVAFNLGVEAGQLVVVAACLPGLLLLGRSPAYPKGSLQAASLAIALLGALWFVERAVG